MKTISKIAVACSILFLLSQNVSAQFEIGIKAGLSSTDVVSEGIMINENGKHFQLSLDEANYGYHVGLYTRVSFLGIFIEPSFLLTSSETNFRLKSFGESDIVGTVFSESYQNLDIPLLIGMKVGFLRMQVGPVAHVFLSSSSDLYDISGYEQRFADATYGIQGGIGLDIWKIRIDLNYEANLSAFGEHITIDGTPYSFGDNPSRLIASVGWKF
jgi:hypothetical protein